MTPEQVALLTDRILRCIDRVAALTDGLSDQRVSAVPGIPGWNSLGAISWHVMANAEENLLGIVAGRPVLRDREYEFVDNAQRGRIAIVERWEVLRMDLRLLFDSLTPDRMDYLRFHPRRGQVSVLELLLVVFRHAAEHEGHAQMTRDFVALPLGPRAEGTAR